jgi:hypothetical protein
MTTLKIQFTGSIEDDEHLRLSAFIEELNSMREALTELDKALSHSEKATVDYRIVDLTHSSPAAVVLEPIPTKDTKAISDVSGQIVNKFLDVVEGINNGVVPRELDSDVLEHFGKIGWGFRRKISKIVLVSDNREIPVGKTFSAQVKRILGEDQVMDGSVEGTLEMINIHAGSNKFEIYPAVGPKKVKCHFSKVNLEAAIAGVGKYINVTGKVHYRERDKHPYKIMVASIEIYPQEDKLPSIFDLKGIAPDLTGNLSSEEYLRKIRAGQ